jgi:hypothetical protein
MTKRRITPAQLAETAAANEGRRREQAAKRFHLPEYDHGKRKTLFGSGRDNPLKPK